MPDKFQTVECPSCGHDNASYVDKCIICDFSLVAYRKQLHTRNTPEARALEHDETVAPAKKRLGPLPDSDYLADKRKAKNEAAKILQCKECGETNRVGAFMCINCGARLTESGILVSIAETPVEMHMLEDETTDAEAVEPEDYKTQSVADHIENVRRLHNKSKSDSPQLMDDPAIEIPDGCLKFASWMNLRLEVEGFDTPIVIRPIEDKPLLIGRRHDSLPVQPHIDLTPYLEGKHGVSRRHALLRLRGTRLEVQDLNSTNGTSINGVRFSPKESHQVRHQDTIIFGQIHMRVSFVHQVRSASHGRTDELR